MPFNSANATSAGRKGGKASAEARWGGKDPATIRNRSLRLAISQEELGLLDAKAGAEGISRVELVIRAVKAYRA